MELLLTSISWVLITSVISNLSYFDYLNYREFLTTSSQLQKQKTINVSTQIQNYFLTSFSWTVVTSVVSNLSHSDYLNLPVTFDNKLLATKKKGQSYFCIEYGITYLPQLHWSSSNFLSIIITAFWLPMALDNKQTALRIPPKTGEVLKLCLEKGLQCHSNQSQQLFVSWKQGFSPEFSHTSELK